MMDRSHFPQGVARALRQPVSLEVPVCVQGESNGRATFFEDTNTVLVFPEGAVLRVAGLLHPGQRVLLTNRNTRQQLSCRVVYAKVHPGVKGYAEVEFAAATPGFWEGTSPSMSAMPAAPVRSQAPSATARAAASFVEITGVEITGITESVHTQEAPPPSALAGSLTPRVSMPAPQRALLGPPQPPAVDEIEKLLTSRRTESESEAREAERAASAFAENLLHPALGVTTTPAKLLRRVWAVSAITVVFLLAVGTSAGTWNLLSASPEVLPPLPSAPVPPEWAVGTMVVRPGVVAPLPLRKVGAMNLLGVMPPGSFQGGAEMRRRWAEGKFAAPAIARRAELRETDLPEGSAESSAASTVHAGAFSLLPVVSPNAPAPPVVAESKLQPLRLVSSRPPAYPVIARRAGVQGEVVIHARVDEKGDVTAMRVASGPAALRQAALDAVQLWKYEPATLNGKPLNADTVISVKFRL